MGRLQSLLLGSERSLSSNWGRWAQEVSCALDGAVWITMGSGIRPSIASAPTPIEVGPTYGWLFSLGNMAYVELPLHTAVDRSKPLLVGVGWAPAASEVARQVTWTLNIGLEHEGANVAAIDLTKSATTAVPAVAASYKRTGFLLTPAEWNQNDVDEIHVRITREASGAEPTLPGLHHIVLIHSLAL